MSTIDEKRVYDDTRDTTTLYVAGGPGVAAVSVSGDIVGEFSLDRRCSARSIAGGRRGLTGTVEADAAERVESVVAVATDEDVLVRVDEQWVATGHGPATAVGADGTDLLAADGRSHLSRLLGPDHGADPDDWRGTEWFEIADIDAPVRAIDDPFVAAGDGVYRIAGHGLDSAGLDDARDVTAAGVPLVATADGLYWLGNGWMTAIDGDATVATAAATPTVSLDTAHAVVDGRVYAHDSGGAPEDWTPVALPGGTVPVDLGYGEAVYAVTADGTVLVDAGEGWRSRSIGLTDVAGLAVV